MADNVQHRVRDLTPSVREALERLLNRPLQDDEIITVQTYPTREAPSGKDRETARRRLIERIDKTAASVKDVPEAELDAAIDEAVDYVRHHPED